MLNKQEKRIVAFHLEKAKEQRMHWQKVWEVDTPHA